MPNENQDQLLGLSGMEKAAALLLMMGKDSAVKLAGFFSQEDIRNLTRTAGRFKSLDPELVETLLTEFRKNYLSMGIIPNASTLSEIFDEPVEEFEDELAFEDGEGEPEDTSGLAQVKEIEPVLEFLENEPAYIGAFVLGGLPDELSAKVFTVLDEGKRKELFKLFLERKHIEPAIETDMLEALVPLVMPVEEDDGTAANIESAAGMMNFLPDETGDELLAFLNGEDPEAAVLLKKSVFKFADLTRLEKPARTLVFDGVDTDLIVQALSTSTDELRAAVLECLSQRNQRMVEAELSRATVDDEDMQRAQRTISGIVVKLSKDGTITMPKSDG